MRSVQSVVRRKKKRRKIAADSWNFQKCTTFATANEKRLVPWMSGLVSGLQNRVRRFESARNLNNPSQIISERDFLLGTLGTSIV